MRLHPTTLTPEQDVAAGARHRRAPPERSGAHLLLVGPTGSGKTEVYLQACEAALARGLGTIVLVPEIALAPQTVGRFRAALRGHVAILHSALGQAERATSGTGSPAARRGSSSERARRSSRPCATSAS